jgi:hypothetical protein
VLSHAIAATVDSDEAAQLQRLRAAQQWVLKESARIVEAKHRISRPALFALARERQIG